MESPNPIPSFSGLFAARHLAAADPEERLARARALIDRHSEAPLDLDLLARHARFSRYHFLRLFKRAYGETPLRYLQQRRVAEARRLLELTDLTVTEVCMRVGFSSLGSFSSLFASTVGHAPSHYRRRVFALGELPWIQRVPCCFLAAFCPASWQLSNSGEAAPFGAR